MKTQQKRRPRGYVNAPQFEMPIDGGFRLITESAPDFQRIAEEREREEQRERERDAAQLPLF